MTAAFLNMGTECYFAEERLNYFSLVTIQENMNLFIYSNTSHVTVSFISSCVCLV